MEEEKGVTKAPCLQPLLDHLWHALNPCEVYYSWSQWQVYQCTFPVTGSPWHPTALEEGHSQILGPCPKI